MISGMSEIVSVTFYGGVADGERRQVAIAGMGTPLRVHGSSTVQHVYHHDGIVRDNDLVYNYKGDDTRSTGFAPNSADIYL
jgi:hypothetical protein